MKPVDTRWKAGQSGNPHGRRPGARNRATLAAQALLDGEAEGLARKAIELALAGDTVALRLCLERICPPRRDQPVRIDLPEADTAAAVAQSVAAVIAAVADGSITPDQGATLAGILDVRRKAVETLELERRIDALEDRAKA
ncbi:MAG: DUF5681 domain-containing protein [Rhizobiaceae bacterium]